MLPGLFELLYSKRILEARRSIAPSPRTVSASPLPRALGPQEENYVKLIRDEDGDEYQP